MLAAAFAVSVLAPACAQAEEYLHLPGVVHLQTEGASLTGGMSVERMVAEVEKSGLGVAVITDHDNMRVEYGIFPLSGIIKKTAVATSIRTSGPDRYLAEIREAGERHPGVIVIPGTEAVPAYYWEGSYVGHDLSLHNWHRHILLIGMERPEDYEGLPSVGEGFPLKPGVSCIINLWPAALVISGVWLFRYNRKKTVHFGASSMTVLVRPYRAMGGLVFVAGVALIYNNYPYCNARYDQYHGDQGYGPYQEVIDYAAVRGALTFWAHPDVKSDETYEGVRMETLPYPEAMLRTAGYTGFAAQQEGERFTAVPGGTWDRALMEYCKGTKEKPAWALGELDYKEGGWMGDTQTVFLVKEKTKTEVMSAMREGRMYSVTGDYKPVLRDFRVSDTATGGTATMGGEAACSGNPAVRVSMNVPGRWPRKLILIRDGKAIKTFEAAGDVEISYEDKDAPGAGLGYYRLMVERGIVTNPVFVRYGRGRT
ncbi:MAG: hypothetical protein HZA22_04285 [Nitrospirae bacterium]|nr:hypothetical protein [Nitrospirota bacterium]MBI5694955.1 hypothetical protein [Nitrospirota bacterium]